MNLTRLSLLLIFSFSFFSNCYAQDSTNISINKIDTSTLNSLPIINCYHCISPNKKRVNLVTAANIVGYGGTLIALNSAWYKNQPRSSFHFFNDNDEWLQVDKVGHAYSAYFESLYCHEMWKWAGLPRKKAIWIGGLSGVAYQSIIEILDGFSSEYGFSVGDFSANVFGSGLFIAQQLAWNDQKIKFKFSFHSKNYEQQDLNARADKIYGKSAAERMIKDYNAQTYWLSCDLKLILPKSNLPRWLSVAVGYGADGMFGARSNIATDKNGVIIFDRSDIKRYRQWFLAPDIDLTRIKTDKKYLKIILFALNAFKFPAPSLELSNGSLKGHWIHF